MGEPLGREQIELLFRLVKAARAVPRPRQKFELYGIERDPAVVYGAGLPAEGEEVLVDDVWALHNADLILGSWNYAFDPQARFTITAAGERLYDRAVQQRAGTGRATETANPTNTTLANTMTKPPSFFISYSHADKPLAISLKAALVERGAAAWRDEDELRAGDSLAERLADAVHEFEYMAVLVSDASKGSEWCRKELALAVTGGLNQGRVKVMPLKVGDAQMPPVIADLVYIPIDEGSVEEAADRLIRDAGRYASEPTASARITPRVSPPAAAAGAPDRSAYVPLKIRGVVADRIGRPRNDGTAGSALYAVPLELSRMPTAAERQLLVAVWDRPPRWTTMHRPGIASVQGNRLVLEGTTIDEIENYHAETLRWVIEEVNRRAKEIARQEELAAQARERERAEHEERVERARRLKFD